MPCAMSVQDFLDTSWEDINSPTTSSFVTKMPKYRFGVDAMEERLDNDQNIVNNSRKSVKALYNTGSLYVTNQELFADNLTKIGDSIIKDSGTDDEMKIGGAFMKFHTLNKELGAIMKTLMKHVHNIVLFPLDSFVKGNMRECGADTKKSFDKAWKDYYSKYTKLDKEKKQLAREHGIYRGDLSGAEVAEDLEKERRMVQLQMCEYLIKVNEIKTKNGPEFLQHLVEYYGALDTYFEEGRRTIQEFTTCIHSLSEQIQATKAKHDAEKKKLVELRDNLRTHISAYKDPVHKEPPKYKLHPVQGNKIHGYEKTGYLLKKSEGVVRKTWLRRKVSVKDGYMYISRSDQNKEPVKLNLLTSQTKPAQDDTTGRCFDLVSGSQIRTYHFQAEDVNELEEWISVLNNAKEAVLMKSFGDSSTDNQENSSVKELTRSIIAKVKKLPGNQSCCDCGAPDPEWLSCNLGVLVCLVCCGTHRQMGVHISRMQSIVIDDLGTSQLLLARVMGNRNFNDVMEATLNPEQKPRPSQEITAQSKAFIVDKYEHHRYCIKMFTNQEDVAAEVRQAIIGKDILCLLQVFGEGQNIQAITFENDETPLHLAIRNYDGASLHIVDFIIQNSRGPDLDRETVSGDTILHYCVLYGRSECMKLVLKSRPTLARLENRSGKRSADLAAEMGMETCLELLKHAEDKNSHVFNHVNIDWDLIQEDHLYDGVEGGDFSDDDLDDAKPRRPRSRPQSAISPLDILAAQDRSQSPVDISYTVYTFKPETVDGTPTKTGPPPRPKTPNSAHGTLPPSLKKKPAPPPPEPDSSSRRAPTEPEPPARRPLESDFPVMRESGRAVENPLYFTQADLNNARAKAGAVNLNPVARTSSDSLRSSGIASSMPQGLHTASKPAPPPKPNGRPVSGLVNGHRRSKSSDNLAKVQPPEARIPPVPTPRHRKHTTGGRRRCRALYPCTADKPDELTFREGEVILVIKEEDEDWWEGEIEGEPTRRGLFPVSFVHILP